MTPKSCPRNGIRYKVLSALSLQRAPMILAGSVEVPVWVPCWLQTVHRRGKSAGGMSGDN